MVNTENVCGYLGGWMDLICSNKKIKKINKAPMNLCLYTTFPLLIKKRKQIFSPLIHPSLT